MEIKYTDWKNIDLSQFKEAKNFGPTNPVTQKQILRGSQAYDRTHEVDEDGFLKLFIDYTDAKCPFRDEFTEEDWPLRLSNGTEDIYAWVYKYPKEYKPTNCKTQKSKFQMYCRDTKGLCPGGGTGDVMFQLELTGEPQVKPDGSFPLGSIQVIHNSKTGGKYRKATNIIPNGGDYVFILVRCIHGEGQNGYIKCVINGQTVYEAKDSTCFSWDPTATAQPKWGIYDHMINNEKGKAPGGDNNRRKHLDAGIENFTLGISPVTIARRKPEDVAFGDWIEAQIDPYRFAPCDSQDHEDCDELRQQVADLEKANADLTGQLDQVSGKVTQLNADAATLNKTLADLTAIVSG